MTTYRRDVRPHTVILVALFTITPLCVFLFRANRAAVPGPVGCPPLCPLDCSQRDLAHMTSADLDAVLAVASRLPTWNLASFRALVQHWEAVRQASWVTCLDQARAGTQDPADAIDPSFQNAIDLGVLARALYLKCLPPPRLELEWNKGRLNSEYVVDRRVKEIIYTLVDSERVERHYRPSPGNEAERVRPLGSSSFLDEDGWYFYRSCSRILSELALEGQAAEPQVLTSYQVDLKQAFLSWYFSPWNIGTPRPLRDIARGSGHPYIRLSLFVLELHLVRAAIEPGHRSQVACSELFSGLDGLVYLTFMNNWVDLECLKIARGSKVHFSLIGMYEGLERRLARDSLSGAIPKALEVNTRITLLEFNYSSRRGHKSAQGSEIEGIVRKQAVDIIRNILTSSTRRSTWPWSVELDPRDAAIAMKYLESGSEALGSAWSPAMFSAMIEQARSGV